MSEDQTPPQIRHLLMCQNPGNEVCPTYIPPSKTSPLTDKRSVTIHLFRVAWDSKKNTTFEGPAFLAHPLYSGGSPNGSPFTMGLRRKTRAGCEGRGGSKPIHWKKSFALKINAYCLSHQTWPFGLCMIQSLAMLDDLRVSIYELNQGLPLMQNAVPHTGCAFSCVIGERSNACFVWFARGQTSDDGQISFCLDL